VITCIIRCSVIVSIALAAVGTWHTALDHSTEIAVTRSCVCQARNSKLGGTNRRLEKLVAVEKLRIVSAEKQLQAVLQQLVTLDHALDLPA
jgi:hypothetical protein